MLQSEVLLLFKKTETKLTELKEFFLVTHNELKFEDARNFLLDIEEVIDSGFGG